ncbi:hypothetical protein Tco_1198603, partial [Tanacetum coccineum]
MCSGILSCICVMVDLSKLVLAEGVLVNQPTHAIPSRPISDCGPRIPDNGRYDPPGLRFRWAWNRDLRSA